jgi:hypothetical protein
MFTDYFLSEKFDADFLYGSSLPWLNEEIVYDIIHFIQCYIISISGCCFTK